MTASSFDYDQRKHQPVEIEMYFNINRAAGTTAEIRRIRNVLEQKGRKHFHYWIHKHLNVRLDRAVRVNFEKEQRAKRQQQVYASVRRLMMRRIDRRWVAEELPSGKMRFAKKRRKHGRR
jgi:acid stress-induced BolA-like protein IbaG/YrbA